MFFAAIKNEIKDALLCFCLEQCSASGSVIVGEVENLVGKAFEVFGKTPSAHIDPITLYRYHLYAGEKCTEEIFPAEVRDNGVLCDAVCTLERFLRTSTPTRKKSSPAATTWCMTLTKRTLFFCTAWYIRIIAL